MYTDLNGNLVFDPGEITTEVSLLSDGLPELNGWGGWPRRRSYPQSGPRRFSLTIRARKAGGPNLRVRGGAGVEPETDVGPIGLCL